MSFFLPGRSLCAICSSPITARLEAARLPFADPVTAPKLSASGHGHVHRSCWSTWSGAVAFATSARGVYARPGNPAMTLLGQEVDAFLFDVPALSRLRLVDVGVPAELEVSREHLGSFATALAAGRGQVRLGAYDANFDRAGAGISVTLRQAGEPVEQFVLAGAQSEAWCRVLATGS